MVNLIRAFLNLDVQMSKTIKILGYQRKKQLQGFFKIVEYRQLPNGEVKKRTIKKNLTISEAEEFLYKKES